MKGSGKIMVMQLDAFIHYSSEIQKLLDEIDYYEKNSDFFWFNDKFCDKRYIYPVKMNLQGNY